MAKRPAPSPDDLRETAWIPIINPIFSRKITIMLSPNDGGASLAPTAVNRNPAVVIQSTLPSRLAVLPSMTRTPLIVVTFGMVFLFNLSTD